MRKIIFSMLLVIALSHFGCDTNKTDITKEENNMGQESGQSPNTNYNDKEDSDTSINMTSGGGTGTGSYKADSLVNNNKGGGEKSE